MNRIEPRLLKGFRDFFGDELKNRRKVISVFQEVFEKYGFEGLETPTLEYFDVLMGKYGEEEKLVYSFEDHGKRRVAMRYDLTVPTSRVAAQYSNQIVLPWRRYQMQPVWRADNTQKGRFREFWQCDADVIGTDSMIAEAEFIKMGIEILEKLGFKDFTVRINNRKILEGYAEYLEIKDRFNDFVTCLDKYDKIGKEGVMKELEKRGIEFVNLAQFSSDFLGSKEFIDSGETDSSKILNDELLARFKNIPIGIEGVNEVLQIIKLVGSDKLKWDPTIARGLAYYTGPVWEWNINEGGVGSVGGGGRYDRLIGSFTGRDLPATGGSFGIERIIEVMRDREMFENAKENNEVLVTVFDENLIAKSFEVADQLRSKGIKAFVFPGVKPLKKQFEYANKKGIKYVIIIGEDEVKNNNVALKNMESGDQMVVSLDEAIKSIS